MTAETVMQTNKFMSLLEEERERLKLIQSVQTKRDAHAHTHTPTHESAASYTVCVYCRQQSLTTAHNITELEVSINAVEEQNLRSRGFKKINVDLNKGSGGNYFYLWYKNECGSTPITRLQVTFNDAMAVGLINAGYKKIDKDLNAGARGDYIYLWYFKGQTQYDIPIVDIEVTTNADDEAGKFRFGWERLACNLNRGAKGEWIHMWVKRGEQTYISDVTATDSFGSDTYYFNAGYIRVDEDTNRGAEGSFVFIWYRQTIDSSRALTDLGISTNNDEYQIFQQQNYQVINVDLNREAAGDYVYLWHKTESLPIKAISLLVNSDSFEKYKRAGVMVIERDLNSGNKGTREYLCYYK